MRNQLLFILVMILFGSIGLFVRSIELSSSFIALFRATIGSLFILSLSALTKRKLHIKLSRKSRILLILSGAAMGFNWIFLFESYKFTTVSNATLSYYFAPILVLLIAPWVLKEVWTLQRGLIILIALLGLILIVNPRGYAQGDFNHPLGITYGLLAATLYATVILINQGLKNMVGLERTVIQLGAAALVLLPYVLLTNDYTIHMDSKTLFLLLILGVIHTGVAYTLYFNLLPRINSQTASVFSYFDPIFAILFSSLFLNERLTLLQFLGGLLILGSTFLAEYKGKSIHPINNSRD